MNAYAKNANAENPTPTANPPRLLVILGAPLVPAAKRARDYQQAGTLPEAHNQLVHAQEIVIHLRSTLHVEAWDGGPGLASLYDWLHNELIRANITKDPTVTEGCLSIVTDLAETWKAAAIQSAAAGA